MPENKSFQLIVQEKDIKKFKIFLPFILLAILTLTIASSFEKFFYPLCFLNALATVLFIYYIYRLHKKILPLKIKQKNIEELPFLKFFKLKEAYLIIISIYFFNALITAITIFDFSPLLPLLSFILTLGVYSTNIIIENILKKKKSSAIEIIILFVISFVYFIHEFKIIENLF